MFLKVGVEHCVAYLCRDEVAVLSLCWSFAFYFKVGYCEAPLIMLRESSRKKDAKDICYSRLHLFLFVGFLVGGPKYEQDEVCRCTDGFGSCPLPGKILADFPSCAGIAINLTWRGLRLPAWRKQSSSACLKISTSIRAFAGPLPIKGGAFQVTDLAETTLNAIQHRVQNPVCRGLASLPGLHEPVE